MLASRPAGAVMIFTRPAVAVMIFTRSRNAAKSDISIYCMIPDPFQCLVKGRLRQTNYGTLYRKCEIFLLVTASRHDAIHEFWKMKIFSMYLFKFSEGIGEKILVSCFPSLSLSFLSFQVSGERIITVGFSQAQNGKVEECYKTGSILSSLTVVSNIWVLLLKPFLILRFHP